MAREVRPKRCLLLDQRMFLSTRPICLLKVMVILNAKRKAHDLVGVEDRDVELVGHAVEVRQPAQVHIVLNDLRGSSIIRNRSPP